MTRFVALISSSGNPLAEKSPIERDAHLKAMQGFIGGLMRSGEMILALPLEMAGDIISGVEGRISQSQFVVGEQPVAGLYLIEAANLDAATALVRRDPRLGDALGWRIEIRPVMSLPGISE